VTRQLQDNEITRFQ